MLLLKERHVCQDFQFIVSCMADLSAKNGYSLATLTTWLVGLKVLLQHGEVNGPGQSIGEILVASLVQANK